MIFGAGQIVKLAPKITRRNEQRTGAHCYPPSGTVDALLTVIAEISSTDKRSPYIKNPRQPLF